ncbi:MAG: hypothetical protein LUO84_03245 [Methanomassiliicoccales archaeon]|nr:hypothetical protein [Methanomassiliicoccales archaeon]
MLLSLQRLGKDKNGGIEGLPLQLMIMVIIAGVGTAIILGWMTNLQAPNGIGAVYSSPTEIILEDENNDGIHEKDSFTMTITVFDQKGDGIQGANVILDGGSIVASEDGRRVIGQTDSTGTIEFSGLHAMQIGQSIGFVSVTVIKSGYGTDTSLTIPIISE